MCRSSARAADRMTEKILTLVFVFINSVVAATGYAGIALLMAIESACIPLPSELIMPFAGYLVYAGRMKLIWVATAGAIGCNLGSLVAYEIGCYGGRPLVERYGPHIHSAARRNRPHAPRQIPRLHLPRIVALVFCARLLWHEAGRELALAGQILPQVRRDHRNRAGSGDRLVPLDALAESAAAGGRLGSRFLFHWSGQL